MTREAPRRYRLILRIYVACLVLVIVVSAALDFVRRNALESSQQRGTLQLARLVTAMAAEGWSHPDELTRQAGRIRSVLDADLAIYTTDGRLHVSNSETPAPPLSPAKQAEVLATDAVSMLKPRTAASAVFVDERPVGYLLLTPRAPAMELGERLLGWALVAALVGAASLLLARSIAKPLKKLTGVARAFSQGDMSARARLDRNDELGELGRALDEMADRATNLVLAQKELLANISHELRTPLSRLRVALDLAIEGGDERRMELLTRNVQDDLTELEQLLTDVLISARLDLAKDQATGTPLPFKKRHVPAQSVIDEACERFEKAHPDRPLNVEIIGELPEIEADPGILRRAIDNLLANAVRYSDRDSPVTLRVMAGGGSLIIDVVDQGEGIAPEDLPHIFEPFYRADRSRTRASGGVGMGLLLARRIVEAHGGSISVESALSRGTTMRILLPAASGAVEQAG